LQIGSNDRRGAEIARRGLARVKAGTTIVRAGQSSKCQAFPEALEQIDDQHSSSMRDRRASSGSSIDGGRRLRSAEEQMAPDGRAPGFQFGSARKRKEFRNSPRKDSASNAWIRLEEGFAVRPCTVVDLSDTGVQIVIDGTGSVAGVFSLLLTRSAGAGRRCRVKWRRGSRIGAEFL
jgi:PilZ domain